MYTDDPAFLWETEALRASRSKPDRAAPMKSTTTAPAEGGFATLAEASSQTGIPVNTLRKWSRRGLVTSYLDMRAEKPVRMVNMEAVRARAESLGRDVDAEEATIDLTQRATIAASRKPPAPAVTTDPPQGTMIVPISAWEKMLHQLGNLHEAGREMAEARERAAKAETEAMFLRERLRELRAELDAERSADPAVEPAPDIVAGPTDSRHDASQAIRSLWDRAAPWRRRR